MTIYPAIRLCLFMLLFLAGILGVRGQNMIKKQRVVEITNYALYDSSRYDGDSIRFYYSGKNGSRFIPYHFSRWRSYSWLGYNVDYDIDDLLLPTVPDIATALVRQNVKFDSAYVVSNISSNPSQLYKQYVYNSYINDSWTGNKHCEFGGCFIFTIAYDSGLPAIIYEIRYDSTRGGDTDTIAIRKLYYDSKQRLSMDSLFKSADTFVSFYTYNDDGRLISRIEYFDAIAGRMSEQKYYYYNDRKDLHQAVKVNMFGDTTGLLIHYDEQGRIVGTGRLENTPANALPRYHYDAKGNMDTLYDGAYKTVFYYNSYNNPDSAISTFISAPSPNTPGTVRTRYTYELYDDAEPDTAKGGIVIFPNPAKGLLHIKWNAQRPSATVVITLYNPLGQQVMEVQESNIAAQTVIRLPELPSAVYFLTLTTESGGLLHRGGVVIQH